MKMKSTPMVLALLILIGFAVTLVLWRPWATPHGKETIKVGYLPITADLPFFVALEKGYFTDQGLQVEPVGFRTSNQVAEAMIAGHIDATSVIALTVLFSVEAAAPGEFKVFLITVVNESSRIHNILVGKQSAFLHLSDLKGKKIGTFPGSNYVGYTKLIMKDFLDPEKELTIIPMRPHLQLEALASGQVDAIFTLEPTGTLALEKGNARVLSENPLVKYIMNPFPTAASALSSRLLRERPEVARKYTTAIYKAVDFITSNEKEARGILTKYAGVSETVAQKSGLYVLWKHNEIDHDVLKRYAELTYEQGGLARRVKVADLVFER